MMQRAARTRSVELSGAGRIAAALTAAAFLTAAPGQAAPKPVEDVPLETATGEVREHQLLDVGIQVLDPGLPTDDDALFDLEDKGIYEDMRKSEARYLPVRLMDTLQSTGFWGAVRVVPKGMDSVDVSVAATIRESNGRKMILEVSAYDATGRGWFDRTYKQLADYRAYRESKSGIVRQPFQNIYNRIANDLLKERDKLAGEGIEEIRRVTQLKFAAYVAPAAFGDYLGRNRKGHTVVVRLPAEDDPIMLRVFDIRERDHMLIDTLTEHYTNFYAQMDESYVNWRKFSYDEIRARRKAKRQARMRQVLGAVAILGGVAVHSDGDPYNSGLGDAAILGGAMAIQSGSAKMKEAKMHTEALRELASSFDAEMEPLLIEVEGHTLRLTGSAEAQYAAWRELMRKIFVTETGLPVDPDTGEEIAVDAAVGAAKAEVDLEAREN